MVVEGIGRAEEKKRENKIWTFQKQFQKFFSHGKKLRDKEPADSASRITYVLVPILVVPRDLQREKPVSL